MEPVTTNTRSKRTGHPISSDDVIWPGNCCLPCFSFCDNVSLTDVVTTIGQKVCNQFNAYAPGSGLTVGQWISFTAPLSGSGPGSGGGGGAYTFAITLGTGSVGNLFYKFTPSGDLLFKGSLFIQLTPASTTTITYDAITLGTIPASSFPTGWAANAVGCSKMLTVDAVINQSIIVYDLNINYNTDGSGTIVLFFVKYASTSVPDGTTVSFCGTQFNLQ